MTPNERKSTLTLKGIKQADLARKAGVSRVLVCQLINGKAISLRVQKIIAREARVAFNTFW